VGWYFAARAKREEVYLGRQWTGADLRKKIAPLLREDFRANFVARLDRQETQEQIAQIADEQGQVAAQRKHLKNEFERQMHLLDVKDKNLTKTLRECQRRLQGLGKKRRAGDQRLARADSPNN
jgi:hypothetical protein